MEPMALWCVAPQTAERRPAELGDGLLVETLFTGISRGTERLVWEGSIPTTQYERMRGPHQEGDFSFPIKYGYCAVGLVKDGDRHGELVFALHPHQDAFRLPGDALTPLPAGLPAERAVLAANMETALTIVWDSGVAAGDRVIVVGAGVVGCLVGYLAAQLPGTEVTLVDTNTTRADLAGALGCDFAQPEETLSEADVVIHTSASEAGLVRALEYAGHEATVVEASWHGDKTVSLPLGADFHSKRLRLVSSQVGSIPPVRAPRWTHARRLGTALSLLLDPVLDRLISGESAFEELPGEYGTILTSADTLCHRVRYRAS